MATAPDSSVLSEIALQLSDAGRTRSRPRQRLIAMATLVSPTRALTPHHVIADFPGEPFILNRLDGGSPISATVVLSASKADLAVLALASELRLTFGDALPVVESPPTSNRWMSLVKLPGMREPRLVTGALTAIEDVEGIPHLRLEVHDPLKDSAGISGAPVIVNGALAGIIARASRDGAVWYALAITRALLAGLEAPAASSEAAAQRAPFDARRFLRGLSPSSSTAIRQADGMRRWSNQARIHMEHLVMGLFLKTDGPTDRLFSAHGIGSHEALREVLATGAEVRLPNPGEYQVKDELRELPPVSVHVQEALEHSQAVADRVGSDQVQSRHLLYGVLSVSECTVVKALLARGIKRDEIALTDRKVDPDAGGTPIVGADSDAPSGEDRLGLEQEIAALSALVATRDTNTPMSIGLFGNWGSGKSFFMLKMDEQIRQFRDVAKADPTSPYCSSIVQLWFNAWHYIDKSLWASLGAEIFEGLAHALTETQVKKEGRSQLDDARTDLLIKREAAESERKQATEELERTRTELNAHNAGIDRIRRQTDREVEASLGTPALAAEVLNVATSQPEVKKALDEASRGLGLDEINERSSEASAQVTEILAIGSTWQSLWRSVREGGSARWWIGAAVVAGVAILATPLFPIAVSWLETPARRLLSALTAFSALVAPALLIARRVTGLVNEARASLKTRIEQERQLQIETLEQAREPVVQKEAEDRAAVENSTQRVKQIDEQLAQLQPARQFIDFIRQRNQSDAYTRHFGVIARARQDFEELTRLMKLMREAPPDVKASADGIRPVERIVLYIDDLDRCPEKKVFQVLQAVHLLLAFPLFVVVVGVDPRWLLHSLRSNLAAFDDQTEKGEVDEDERLRWQSTPLNYLEKIFQIPFTLRPMADTGYEQLIDELTKPRQPSAHEEAPDDGGTIPPLPPEKVPGPPAPGAEVKTVTPSVETVTTPQPEVPTNVAPAPQAAAVVEHARQTHERLTLNTWESGYMKLLFPLIPSPRAAKRFVNVYRLLRGVLPNEERTLLIGTDKQGGYRAVLLLLGMVTGYPVEATVVIRELLERVKENGGSEEWWTMLDAIRGKYLKSTPAPKPSRRVTEQTKPPKEQTADQRLDDEDAYRWEEFFESLDLLHDNVGRGLSAKTMARWAPVVARYSFASGRLLVAERRPESVTPS
jgi:hypothetical protein